MRLVPQRTADNMRELPRRGQRARGNNGARNPPRLGLIAQRINDIGNLGFIGSVDEIGSTWPRLLHPHVERTIGLE